MAERLANGQIVGVVAKENPDKNKEYKIEMARIFYQGNLTRIDIDRKPMGSCGPISMIEGAGIQYTFPELAGVLMEKPKVFPKK